MAYVGTKNASERVNKISQKTTSTEHYPTVSADEVKLSEKRLSPQSKRRVRQKIHDYITSYNSTAIGHQTTRNLQFSQVHGHYLDILINNVGDPFVLKPGINTKFLERAVLDYFAKLWNIGMPAPAVAEDHEKAYWGYVLSSCSEANLQAMYNARDYLRGLPPLNCDHICDKGRLSQLEDGLQDNGVVTSPNAFTPVAFFSEAAHYGHPKAMQVLQIKTFHELGSGHFPCPLTYPDDYPSNFCEDSLDSNGWPYLIPVDTDDLMHLPCLVKLVDSFAKRGYPPIVIFTSGTSFRGNFEDTQAAIGKLLPILKRNNLYKRRVYYESKVSTKFDVRHGFWFHVDGAFGASYLPFLEMAINNGLTDTTFPDGFPVFDFRIPEVMSITVSIYKWLGCPFPSAIYMTRKQNQLKPPSNPLYVDYQDTTLSGSRNGHTAMILWEYLSERSYEDLMERAARQAEMVKLTLSKFKDLEQEIDEDLWVSNGRGSLFVCFKRCRSDIVSKYSLGFNAVRTKTDQGVETRLYSRVCLMDHVDEGRIEKLFEDLRDPGAFPPQSPLEQNV